MNPDGSDLENLTQSPEEDLYPSVSPDGIRMAFYSRRTPVGIYVMDIDGGDPRHVLGGYDVEHLTWSGDGRRLAFQGTEGAGFEILVVNVDGSGLILAGHPSW
ncbi:MAG: TolB family protein [Gemmatimonadaceae bacterium]